MSLFSGRGVPFFGGRHCRSVCVCVCGRAEAPPARVPGATLLPASGAAAGGCLAAARGEGRGARAGCAVGVGRAPRPTRASTPRALPQPLEIKLAALIPPRPSPRAPAGRRLFPGRQAGGAVLLLNPPAGGLLPLPGEGRAGTAGRGRGRPRPRPRRRVPARRLACASGQGTG